MTELLINMMEDARGYTYIAVRLIENPQLGKSPVTPHFCHEMSHDEVSFLEPVEDFTFFNVVISTEVIRSVREVSSFSSQHSICCWGIGRLKEAGKKGN